MSVRAGSKGARCAGLLIAMAFTLAGCGGQSDSGDDLGYVAGEGVVDQIAAEDRRELPPFEGGTLDGEHFDSRDHLGEVLVINVWGSWCPPCRKEAPELRKAWEDFKTQDVQFVGIDIRDNDAAALAFERKYNITYPSITTADSGPAMLAVGTVLPRNAVPSTLVVDPDGRVAARIVGGSTYLTFRDLITGVLEESDMTSGSPRSGDPESGGPE